VASGKQLRIHLILDNAPYHRTHAAGVPVLYKMKIVELMEYVAQQGPENFNIPVSGRGSGKYGRVLRADIVGAIEAYLESTQQNELVIATLCRERDILLRFLPPYSPFFSSIELLWRSVKGQVARTYDHERSAAVLISFVQEKCRSVPDDYCKKWHKEVLEEAREYYKLHREVGNQAEDEKEEEDDEDTYDDDDDQVLAEDDVNTCSDDEDTEDEAEDF
jgi:transposase